MAYPEIFIGGGQVGWGLDRGSPPQWGWVWEGLCQKKNIQMEMVHFGDT